MTKIIQGRKYKLLVGIYTAIDSIYVSKNGLLTVRHVDKDEVHFDYKVCAITIKAKLSLTTFIHCTELVEEGEPVSHDVVQQKEEWKKMKEKALEALDKMFAIARELSGK